MRSLYYQLIVLVVCNFIAITVSLAFMYLFIILGVFEGPLIYGVLVKAVDFHLCIPGSSPPVIFLLKDLLYFFLLLYVQGRKRIHLMLF